MRFTSPYRQERERHQELLMDLSNGNTIGTISSSIPVDYKAWLMNEADRRGIPISWLLTELLKLGIEAYEIIGAPDADDDRHQ